MTGASASTSEVQDSIRARVRGLGGSLSRLRPDAMLVVLAGAALWPIAAPLLGAGTAVGVIGGAMGLLKGPGESFISDYLKRVAKRTGGSAKDSQSDLREEFDRELLSRLGADDEGAAALREDVSRLIRIVGGVEVALEAAVGEVKDALAQGLAEVGGSWREFRWLLVEVRVELRAIQARQAEGLALQREQLDLLREQLVKTNLLVGVYEQRPQQVPVERRVVEEEAPADVACPYKGLAAFQPDDARYFFGREELVADVLARLAESPLLALVGASGSGKSSLLRAGLVPALWTGALPGSKSWAVRIMTPGEFPLEELAMRVSLLQGLASGSLLADLWADPRHAGLAIRQALLDEPADRRLVLVIDQLEELFTLCRNEQERRLFTEALVGAVEESGSRGAVIIAVPADFYGRLGAYPDFAAAVGNNQVLVGPMSSRELAQAIELPASVAKLSLEPGLVDVMVRDVAGEPGALPLLSHALLETWKRRRGRTLTVAGYLESGGVREAIARTADRVFAERLSAAQQSIARRIFLRLTEPGEGTEDTRRRASLDELVPQPEEARAVEAVVSVLAEERLITTSEGSVEVAHEALIRHWPALRGWLDEDRAALRTHRRLAAAAAEWDRLEHDEGALYRGARLAEAVAWLDQHSATANEREREFVRASSAVRDRERLRKRRRIAVLGAVLLLGLVASTTAAIIALRQRDVANQERRVAQSRAIAVTAVDQIPLDPQLGLLLAIEAAHLAPTGEATDALRRALVELRERAVIPHSADVVAVSHDGRTLLTYAIAAGDVALWDAQTGRRRVQIASGGLDGAALSPSGRLVVTVDDAGTAVVWTSDGRRLAQQRSYSRSSSPGNAVGEAPFSPGERLIVTSDGARTATIWEPATGRILVRLHAGGVISDARFSPDGRYVAATIGAGSGGAKSELWSVAAGRPVTAVAGGVPRFSRDGRRMLTLAGGQVDVWDVPSGRRVAALRAPADPTDANDVATFSENGRYVLTVSPGGVRVFDIAARRTVDPAPMGLRVPEGTPEFSPDGRFAVAGDQLFSVTTGETLAPFRVGTQTQGVSAIPVFSPDGSSLITSDDRGVHVLATPDWRTVPINSGLSQVLAVAVRRDRLVAAAGDGPGTARVWQAPGAPLESGVASPAGPGFRAANVALTPDGEYAAALTPAGGLDVWRVSPWQLVARLSHVVGGFEQSSPPQIVIAPGAQIAGVFYDGETLIWNVTTHQLLAHRSESTGGSGDSLTLSQDGFLAASSDPNGAKVWEAHTGRLVATLRAGGSDLAPVAFNRAGTRVLTVSSDRTARVWDARSGRAIAVLTGHREAPTSGAFSADDRFVVTASTDSTVRAWEADTGRAVATLPVHASQSLPQYVVDAPGTIVGFSSPGPTVLVAANGVVDVIPCEVCRPFGELLKMADHRVLRSLTPQERREFLHG